MQYDSDLFVFEYLFNEVLILFLVAPCLLFKDALHLFKVYNQSIYKLNKPLEMLFYIFGY